MGFHALIASKEPLLVERFASALGGIGVIVESVSHADRALSMLVSRAYKAILLDCSIEDGIDLLQIIRSERINRRALVIAFAQDEASANKARLEGANFVLTKPIDWKLADRTLRAARGMIIRERRRCLRERVRGSAKLRTDDGVYEARLFDLSDDGVALRTLDTIPSGMPVRVEFTIPPSRGSVECAGRVAWTNGNLLGVAFTDLPVSSARQITAWIDCRGRTVYDQRPRSFGTRVYL